MIRAALAALVLVFAACTSGDAPAPAAAAPAAVCEHGFPGDLCVKCNPDLAPVFQASGDWCAEHGVPESQCRQCNPDVKVEQAEVKDWCKEHGVPESKCTKCSPKLVAKFIEAGDYCREHGVHAIVKGLRAVTDFDYELQMAQMNQRLSGVDTLFMSTNPEYSFLSSSLIKEVVRYGGDVSGLVPDVVLAALEERMR